MRKLVLFLVLALLPGLSAPAQEPDLLTKFWPARWITVPGTGAQDYGVYYFRKDVALDAVPTDYVVHVSGDNRYKFYVNGTLVSLGPAKGDATHWNYETVDLAPYLRPGTNVLAALVYHEGEQKPDSQVSVAAGFLLQGEGNAAELKTDRSWKCIQDPSYSPLKPVVSGYYVAGPGEEIDMATHLSDWRKAEYSVEDWKDARQGPAGEPKNVMSNNQGEGHNLRPSTLPQMERTPQRLAAVRRSTGVAVPAGFLAGKAPLVVPAGTKAEILLDNGVLTNAYLHMSFGGGKGSEVHLGYAETLYIPAAEQVEGARMPRLNGKGNRNEIEGKVFVGREDVIRPDGRAGQEFETLSWRTYRYVRLQVETAEEPLTISDLSGIFTGYPFTLDASLDTDSAELQKMLEIGWRTARLCAVETYMDCPYYEQLQYLGDTRIQALVTLYNSRDDRLVRNFLYLSDISRSADGITKSRYPTTIPQHIQPYALSYIYALHDYLMYGADPQFVLDLIPGAEQILLYFSRFQQEDGRIRDLPGWNFSDWVYVPTWNNGAPRLGADGCSINMDLQLMLALQMMAEMEEYRGNAWQAAEYRKDAEKLGAAVKKAYWNEARGLFSDRAEQDNYSQHGNALALLCGIVDDPQALARKLMTDETLAPCSVYYRYYLHEALVKAGFGDDYLDWLDVWRENIAMGLTTWAEMSNVSGSRSDCHAWGSSPNIELFRTVLGIDSAAPAFREVRIEPHLGALTQIGGTMPHPAGAIRVSYRRSGNTLRATVTLPAGISGSFVWNGKTYPLKPGTNTLNAQ